ncbi:MAG: hypothetical protein WBG46_09710 [Nonlabens sp.]
MATEINFTTGKYLKLLPKMSGKVYAQPKNSIVARTPIEIALPSIINGITPPEHITLKINIGVLNL